MTVKEFARMQWDEANETGDTDDMVGVVVDDMFIINPWVDETGRIEFSSEEAERHYGKEVVLQFANAVRERLLS